MPVKSIFNRMVFMGIFLCLSLLFVGCGQRGTPNGGTKDTESPKIKASSPLNNSTNFTGQEITLQFDEYVKVKSFQNEFIISPPIQGKVNYKLRGKKLILSFDSAFAENTTYSMFLGKSVVDLNEGNVLDSNSFVFSTGATIDSLSYEGHISDAFSGKPEDDLLVFLYRNHADSAPQTELPTYFAVAKKGRFEFQNLAEGSYRLFALKDENNNYKYDLPTEKIAFTKELVHIVPPALELERDSIDSTVTDKNDTAALVQREGPHDTVASHHEEHDHIDLLTFVGENTKKAILKPYFVNHGHLIFPFLGSPSKFEMLCENVQLDSTYQRWTATKDTLHVYRNTFPDSAKYHFILAADTMPQDTFKIKYSEKKRSFVPNTNYKNKFANNYTEALSFSSELPITRIADSALMVLTETDTTYLLSKQWVKNEKHFTIDYQFMAGVDYQVKLLPSMVFDTLGLTNQDTLHYDFPMAKEGSFGNLEVDYRLSVQSPLIFQLMKGETIIEQYTATNSQGKLSFKGLDPGSYTLRAIIDENQDGIWNVGNYDFQRQPEKVLFLKKSITIRANWDMVTEWNQH